MFQEKRKQGLAFWIECPWGVGREAGLVQIKLMLLMDLVLVEMGAAVSQQQQNRWGEGGASWKWNSHTLSALAWGGPQIFLFLKQGDSLSLLGHKVLLPPLHTSLV